MAPLLVVRPPFSFLLLLFISACASHPGSVTQRIEDVETKNALSETEQARPSTASYEQASGYSELMSQKTSTLLSEALHMLRRVKDVRERRWLEAFIHRLGALAADLERDGRGDTTVGPPPPSTATSCVRKPCRPSSPKLLKTDGRGENEVTAPDEKSQRPHVASRKAGFDEEDELVQQLHSSHNHDARPAPKGKITVKVWSHVTPPPAPLHLDAALQQNGEVPTPSKEDTVIKQTGKADQVLDISKRTKEERRDYGAIPRELKLPYGVTTSLPSQRNPDRRTVSNVETVGDDELVRQLQEEKLLLVSTRGPDLARFLLLRHSPGNSCVPPCSVLGTSYEERPTENGE